MYFVNIFCLCFLLFCFVIVVIALFFDKRDYVYVFFSNILSCLLFCILINIVAIRRSYFIFDNIFLYAILGFLTNFMYLKYMILRKKNQASKLN